MHYIMLRLEGHIQSWGERSYWDERDTASMPTKSGVVGLIACCMGLSRDSNQIPEIYDKTTLSVRIDDAGRILRDYQTIENTMQADGKINTNMVVSPRYYLTDASFLVALGVENDVLRAKIINDLQNPFWTPYLGRKCCVPSLPIYINHIVADNPVKALSDKRFKIRHFEEEPSKQIELNIEGKGEDDNIQYKKRDVYGITRFFKYRNVYQHFIPSKDFPTNHILEEVSNVSVTN